jgi:hypothetical protein
MKKNFKLVTLLTLFTIVLNVFSVLVLMKPAFAATLTGSDTATSLKAGATGVTHTFAVSPLAGSDNIMLIFPSGFTLGGVGSVTSAGGTCADPVGLEVTCDPWVGGSVVVTGVINPTAIAGYSIKVLTTTGAAMFPNSFFYIDIPIVDSDMVNVTGYITSTLYFDLDTGTDNNNCAYNACKQHSGSTGATEFAGNYTVDLGNLTTLAVNHSSGSKVYGGPGQVLGYGVDGAAGAAQSVKHADNQDGAINSIYFDLSTNAASGAVVTYKSMNGELRGPGHSATIDNDLDIPSTNGLTNLVANTAGYGIQLLDYSYFQRDLGKLAPVVNCGATSITWCMMGAFVDGNGTNTQGATALFTAAGSIQAARARVDVGAAIDGTNVPGTYLDQITFIATSVF